MKISLASKYLLAYILAVKKTGKQKQSRKPTHVRQREIIDAAMKILTSEGARQFTAERLGTAVGITGGTIFRHFESMEEILDGVVDRIEEIIFAGFPPKADNPIERLRRFFEGRAQVITKHPEISKLLLTSILIPNSCCKTREKRLRELKQRSRNFVTTCLKEAKEDRLLAEDISYEESTVLVLGAIYAIGQMVISAEGLQGEDNLIERVWYMLERSLTKSK